MSRAEAAEWLCLATNERYFMCNLPADHEGPHEAHGFDKVCASWPQAEATS